MSGGAGGQPCPAISRSGRHLKHRRAVLHPAGELVRISGTRSRGLGDVETPEAIPDRASGSSPCCVSGYGSGDLRRPTAGRAKVKVSRRFPSLAVLPRSRPRCVPGALRPCLAPDLPPMGRVAQQWVRLRRTKLSRTLTMLSDPVAFDRSIEIPTWRTDVIRGMDERGAAPSLKVVMASPSSIW